jgi:hypothetical protein
VLVSRGRYTLTWRSRHGRRWVIHRRPVIIT